jgi:hypothetical protein
VPAAAHLDRRSVLRLPIGVGAAAAGATTLAAGATAATTSAAPAPAAGPSRPASSDAWTFGLMSDTQWGEDADGENPGSIVGGLQGLINQRMIDLGAAFLLQVGDNVDVEDDRYNDRPDVRTLPIKGELVQPLYDAGIGFYSLRGNHEASQTAAQEFPEVFPQHHGEGPHPLGGATNFSSPSTLLEGLSYSFDVRNLRLVVLDQFTRPDGSGSTDDNILDQLDWIEERVMDRPEHMHCIIAAHKNIIGGNHVDSLFGENPADNADGVDRFLRICDEGGVAFVWGGHDHHHKRSVIISRDGRHSVEQLIAGSDSSKFYTPRTPAIADSHDGPSETVLAEELWTLTHYVITVDGPVLSVDFYSMSTGTDYGPASLTATPSGSDWHWREGWASTLNGSSTIVEPGGSYEGITVADYQGHAARILAGTNTAERTDYAGRAMSQRVVTGWTPAARGEISPRLHLHGLHHNLALHDDTLTGLLPAADESGEGSRFVLEIDGGRTAFRADGSYGIAALTADGDWENAAARGGAEPSFERGPARTDAPVGTYGVDPATKQAWAVLDRGGVFALHRGI